MGELRFPGLATTNSSFNEFLHSIFGYRAYRDGRDWVVPATDRALRAGPRDPLTLHHEIDLSSSNLASVANELLSFVPDLYDKYQPTPPGPVTVAGGYGRLSRVDELTVKLALLPRAQLQDLLTEEILPFMRDEMGATHASAITVDADAQQGAISLAKIALITERVGLQEAQRLVLQERVLHHISPHPLMVVEYPTALTIFSPFAITLPLVRHGCVWHFYRSRAWVFPHAATENVLYQFQASLHPSTDKTNLYVFDDIDVTDADEIWRWLRMVVFAINSLMRFLNDPLSFAGRNGRIDCVRQMQALAAINLIFADLRGLNFSTAAHNRTVYAYAVLDKLGNLRWELGGRYGSESKAAANLASLSQSKWLRGTFKSKVGSRWPSLGERLRKATYVFADVHRHLAHELGNAGRSEDLRLARLRAHRSLNHGTFLSKQKFDKLFLGSRGAVPDALPALPVLLTLGLMLDPKGFTAFQPRVQPQGTLRTGRGAQPNAKRDSPR